MVDDRGTRWSLSSERPDVSLKVLAIAIAATSLAQLLVKPLDVFCRQTLAMNPGTFLQSLYLWQPVTSIFVHSGFAILIPNLLCVWVSGAPLSRSCRRWEFVSLFLACGIFSSLAFFGLQTAFGSGGPEAPVGMGCGGVAAGLIAAYAFLLGETQLSVFGAVAMKAKHLALIYFGMLCFSLFTTSGDALTPLSSLAGAIVGWGYALAKRRKPSRPFARANVPAKPAGRMAALEMMDDDPR